MVPNVAPKNGQMSCRPGLLAVGEVRQRPAGGRLLRPVLDLLDRLAVRVVGRPPAVATGVISLGRDQRADHDRRAEQEDRHDDRGGEQQLAGVGIRPVGSFGSSSGSPFERAA